MKNRVRKIANFFAFNLLFFALYLNFIQKDKLNVGASSQNAAFSESVLVDHPEQVNKNKNETIVSAQQTAPEKVSESNTTALKLSIN
jgi:hypothetical protein